MGYIDSSAYFCTMTKTVTNMENATTSGHHAAPPHSLKIISNTRPKYDNRGTKPGNYKLWEELTNLQQSSAVSSIDVYLD